MDAPGRVSAATTATSGCTARNAPLQLLFQLELDFNFNAFITNFTMPILNFLGNAATRFSEAQSNSNYYLLRTPLFTQFLDICFWNFPDPLDLYAWSYELVPIYFLAGAIDFGIMTLTMGFYSQIALIALPRVDSNGAGPLLSELQSPRSRVFRGLILISFILRAWRLGFGNIKRTCNIHRGLVQWSEMRKMAILILVLCPALFWHCLSELVLRWIKVEKPWLAQIGWLLLSGDWETATLWSGFFLSKGKDVIAQENAARLNETWTSFNLRVLKLTVLQTTLEMFLRNFAYIVLGLIVAVGRNAPLIMSFIGKTLQRLREIGILERLTKVDEYASQKWDYLLMVVVRHFRKLRGFWQKSIFSKYTAYLSWWFVLYAQPIILGTTRYTASFLWGTLLKVGSAIQKSKVGYYLRLGDQGIFSPIPSRRFRLLEVEPSLFYDEDIHCNLGWHNLTSAPSYTAISYVWGSSKLTSTIILNGKETRSTASAHAALKGLRSRWRKKQFWIDAICIDQNSDVDKGEQISIMADIYRNAKQVTIWLGPEENGALASSLVRRIFIRTRLSDKLGSLTSSYSLNAPAAAWNVFQKLLQNPWFHRSWVVQEVMSRNVTVQYGDAKIDWTLLSQFAMAVENDTQTLNKIYALTGNDSHWSSQSSSLNLKYIRIMEEFRSMQPRQLFGLNTVSYTDEHLSLLFYLTRMFRSNCRFQATNTQDRIYALLNLSGLASNPEVNLLLNAADLLGNKTPENTPDYYDRLAKFFTIVATHFLTTGPQSRRLDFLSHAGTTHRSTLPHLPSWVPDWSLEPTSNPLLAHDGSLELLQHPRLKGILESVADWQSYDEMSFNGRPKQQEALKRLHSMSQTMISTSTSTIYRATKTTVPNFTLHEDLNILELKGGIIDRLHGVGEPFPEPQQVRSGQQDSRAQAEYIGVITVTLFRWFALSQRAIALSHPVPIDEEHHQAHRLLFERTLLADVSHPAFDFTLPSSPVRPIPIKGLGFAGLLIGIVKKTVPVAKLQKATVMALLVGWVGHLSATCKGRVFGVTERGKMGLFPVGGKVGDEVCLVEGVGVPLLVRKIGDDEGMMRASAGIDNDRQDVEEVAGGADGRQGRVIHELVGVAYVHGIMDGEAMEGIEEAGSILLK